MVAKSKPQHLLPEKAFNPVFETFSLRTSNEAH